MNKVLPPHFAFRCAWLVVSGFVVALLLVWALAGCFMDGEDELDQTVPWLVVLGGGAYSVPKALLKDLPDAEVDVAEIEPSLFDLGKNYFAVPDDARLHNFVQDGRRFLQETDASYGLIFSDVYASLYSVPAQFTTKEFFALAKSRLEPDGLFVANLIGDVSRQEPSFIFSSYIYEQPRVCR